MSVPFPVIKEVPEWESDRGAPDYSREGDRESVVSYIAAQYAAVPHFDYVIYEQEPGWWRVWLVSKAKGGPAAS